jgi:hypothetical protein
MRNKEVELIEKYVGYIGESDCSDEVDIIMEELENELDMLLKVYDVMENGCSLHEDDIDEIIQYIV